jgi:Ca-activated chloride channel family protein
MTRRLPALLPVAILLVAAAAACAQEDVIRVDVRLVRILATVKNNMGDLVGSLNKSDFEVYDNGVPQELKVFEHHTDQPLSVAVLLDTSASTGIELRYELDAVRRFFKALFQEGNSSDTTALYTFNFQVNQETPYTRRLPVLEQALKRVKNEGGTSLYDAICLAAEDLEKREGRHVIVVITDGGDTTSYRKYHDALEAAQVADAVLYPILVMPITNDPGRNIGGENALTTLAAGTGGRVFTPALGATLDSAFTEILRDLRTQYLLGYYPRNVPLTKDRFHRIEVKVRRPDLRVSARSGYYGDAEEAQRPRGAR